MKHLTYLLVVLIFASCASGGTGTSSNQVSSNVKVSSSSVIPTPGKWMRNVKIDSMYGGEKFSVPVNVYFPAGYTRGSEAMTFIMLHDSDTTANDWDQSIMTRVANENKYLLVAPTMGHTVYENDYFPETTAKWSPMPGGRWVGDVLLPWIQDSLGAAKSREKTAIIGYGTGARGAVLTGARYSGDIKYIGAMSGYYDNQTQTRNRQLSAVYGDYKMFKERWINSDNYEKLSGNLKNSVLFASHGTDDFIFAFEQSSQMLGIQMNIVKKKNPSFRFIFLEQRSAMHTWIAWNRAIPIMIEFFKKEEK